MANRNRDSGHDWERKLRLILKRVYPRVETARYASREADDNGIDFVNTGCVDVQAKKTVATPRFEEVFDHMKTSKVKVIAWKKRKVIGKKGEFAVLPLEDFVKLLIDLEG